MPNRKKGFQEGFAKFFEDPTREGLRQLLREHLGELDDYEFKREWPTASKLARHILGIANYGGGCIVIGVDELPDKTFEPIGVNQFFDKADIQKKVQKYIPPQVDYQILDFKYDESEYPKIIGKKFQVVIIESNPRYIPFVARIDGDGIQENAIYTRRGTNTIEASYEEIQEIINRRLETGYSSQNEFDLDTHLTELKILFDHIARYYDWNEVAEEAYIFVEDLMENQYYPEEGFDQFVARMIEVKKQKITELLLRR